MACFVYEVRQSRAHTPNYSVTLRRFIERKLSSIGSTLHVHVEEEEWEIFIEVSLMEKRPAIILCGHPLENEVYIKNVSKRFTLRSRIVLSEASVLIEFMIKSARKLLVKPPVTVGLSFCSAALHDELSFVVLFCLGTAAC